MWLQDTGILAKLRDNELNAPTKIPLPRVKINQPLTIYQLATAFVFATFGIVLSVSVFLGELAGQRINSKGDLVTSLPGPMEKVRIT